MQEPPGKAHTIVGTVKVLEAVRCAERANERDLQVYLPPSYDQEKKRYPVLYMQDGQNLFDEATSFSAEWRVDESMEQLSKVGVEAIVVGIPNMARERCDEYSPFPDPLVGGGYGEAYLACLVGTMKPLVDRQFRTRPDRAHTGIMGSSMGGLISLYAFFRYPGVFGFAGAMSPALWFSQRAIFSHLETVTAAPGRIYLDVGTEEGETVVEDARRMHALLLAKGYRRSESLLYVEDEGAGHNEAAWSQRLRTALYFLIPGPQG
jgi:predicted alpha/beta superfamily hydrolase